MNEQGKKFDRERKTIFQSFSLEIVVLDFHPSSSKAFWKLNAIRITKGFPLPTDETSISDWTKPIVFTNKRNTWSYHLNKLLTTVESSLEIFKLKMSLARQSTVPVNAHFSVLPSFLIWTESYQEDKKAEWMNGSETHSAGSKSICYRLSVDDEQEQIKKISSGAMKNYKFSYIDELNPKISSVKNNSESFCELTRFSTAVVWTFFSSFQGTRAKLWPETYQSTED